MVRFPSELLDRPPDRVGGVWVWWNVQPRSLLTRPKAEAPARPARPQEPLESPRGWSVSRSSS